MEKELTIKVPKTGTLEFSVNRDNEFTPSKDIWMVVDDEDSEDISLFQIDLEQARTLGKWLVDWANKLERK